MQLRCGGGAAEVRRRCGGGAAEGPRGRHLLQQPLRRVEAGLHAVQSAVKPLQRLLVARPRRLAVELRGDVAVPAAASRRHGEESRLRAPPAAREAGRAGATEAGRNGGGATGRCGRRWRAAAFASPAGVHHRRRRAAEGVGLRHRLPHHHRGGGVGRAAWPGHKRVARASHKRVARASPLRAARGGLRSKRGRRAARGGMLASFQPAGAPSAARRVFAAVPSSPASSVDTW